MTATTPEAGRVGHTFSIRIVALGSRADHALNSLVRTGGPASPGIDVNTDAQDGRCGPRCGAPCLAPRVGILVLSPAGKHSTHTRTR